MRPKLTAPLLSLYYYCTVAVLLYRTGRQTWSIVEGSVGWRKKLKMKVVLVSDLGVMVSSFW